MTSSFSSIRLRRAGNGSSSPGQALRREVLGRIEPLLRGAEGVADSGTRLMIQASCLDVISSLEDVIAEYRLDDRPLSSAS